jgi:hypothetical protein
MCGTDHVAECILSWQLNAIRLLAWIFKPVLVFSVGFAARASFLYAYYFNEDTRRQLVKLLEVHATPRKRVKGEVYTFIDATTPSVAQLNLHKERKNIRYLVRRPTFAMIRALLAIHCGYVWRTSIRPIRLTKAFFNVRKLSRPSEA